MCVYNSVKLSTQPTHTQRFFSPIRGREVSVFHTQNQHTHTLFTRYTRARTHTHAPARPRTPPTIFRPWGLCFCGWLLNVRRAV